MISQLKQRVAEQPVELSTLLRNSQALPFRMALVKGEFDFAHEMVLRNRNLQGVPGVLVLTPLKLLGLDQYILVSRGFLPLVVASQQDRTTFQRPASFEGVILLKDAQPRTFLSSADPEAGAPHPWVDQWLRPDLQAMAKQLPYAILPIYGEVVPADARQNIIKQILSNEGGREEILSLEMRQIRSDDTALDPKLEYPAAHLDAVIPPDIHLGYTFQWCFIALITLLICLIMQRKPRARNYCGGRGSNDSTHTPP